MRLEFPLAVKSKYGFNDEPQAISEYDIQDLVRGQMIGKYGASLHNIETTAQMRRKTVVESPNGRSELRYQVMDGYGRGNTLHPTKSLAVAEAKDLVQKERYSGSVLNVRAVRCVIDESGKATPIVATVRAVPVAAGAQVVVTLATPKGKPTVTGWVFYGMAAE